MSVDKFIVVTADNLALAINPDRSVGIHVSGVEKHLGLSPGIALMLRLSPQEARAFAQALHRKAEEAEAKSPQSPTIPFADPPSSLN